jgi:DivIVA domain-containing protein
VPATTVPSLFGKSFFKLIDMKITPLEIRQKTFEKNFRGYEKDEVHAFLLTLSQEWERLMDENKELRIKLEGTEREVGKLREVESSLYKTLKQRKTPARTLSIRRAKPLSSI